MTRTMVEEQCPECGVRFKRGAKYSGSGPLVKTCPNGHVTTEWELRKQRRAQAEESAREPASLLKRIVDDFLKRGVE